MVDTIDARQDPVVTLDVTSVSDPVVVDGKEVIGAVDDADAVQKITDAANQTTQQFVDKQLKLPFQPVDVPDTAPEDTAQKVYESNQRREDLLANPSVEALLSLQDESIDAITFRHGQNFTYAQQKLRKEVETNREDASTVGLVTDFVDRYLFRLPTIVEDLTKRQQDEADEALMKSLTLSAADFKVYLDQKVESWKSEGVFRGDNYFALLEALASVENLGVDPMANETQQFTAVGILLGGKPLSIAAAQKVAKQAGKIRKGTTIASKAQAVAGPKAVEDVGEAIVKNGAVTPANSDAINPAMINLSETTQQTIKAARDKYNAKQIVSEIARMRSASSFSELATAEELDQLALDLGTKLANDLQQPLRSMTVKVEDVTDGLGVNKAVFIFGKSRDGTPYKSVGKENTVPPAIQKRADLVEGAKIVPFDENDLSKGYVFQLEKVIDDSQLVGKSEIDLHTRTIGDEGGMLFGSTALRDLPALDEVFKRAEGSQVSAAGKIKDSIKAFQTAGRVRKQTVNKVLTSVRDTPAVSNLKRNLTDEEFVLNYKSAHPEGLEPDEKAFNAYYGLVAVQEADYIVRSVNKVRHFIQKGYGEVVEVRAGLNLPAKQAIRSDIPESAKILDGHTDQQIPLDKLAEDDVVWKLSEPTDDGYQYLIRTPEVRMISPEDVLGYNAGGPRENPFAKYFLVAKSKLTEGAKAAGARPLKTLLTARTEKEMKVAFKEISDIEKALSNPNITDKDAFIQKNNNWNPDIESEKDYIQFKADNDWDLNDGPQLVMKERDQNLIDEETLNADLYGDMSMYDYFYTSNRRSDKPLIEYGGRSNLNMSPSEAIPDAFMNSSYTYAFRAYTVKAMKGWTKAVLDAVDGTEGVNFSFRNPKAVPATNDFTRFFEEVEITGNSAAARNLREQQRIIKRRMNLSDPVERAVNRYFEKGAEHIFGRSINFNDFSVTNTLLKFGFVSTFGFMNASQLVMQGLHATTIMAISPKHGMNAAAMSLNMRQLLHVPNTEAYNVGIEKFAKFYKMSVDDVKELAEYIQTSGRLDVSNDAVELGTSAGRNIIHIPAAEVSGSTADKLRYARSEAARLSGKAMQFGLLPFTTGERISRSVSMITSFLEFKDAHKGMSALSESGRAIINARDHALSLNMNTGSRGMLQSGLMKVPTQWLTYSLRATESIFLEKQFTKAEKARLFAVLAPFYGVTGLGIEAAVDIMFQESASDIIAEEVGAEPAGTLHTAIKYGFFDALSVALLGEGDAVGVGQRLSFIEAFADVYDRLTSGKFGEVIAGPSGGIAQNVMEATFKAFGSVIHGRDYILTEDLLKILRQPTGVDNFFKGIGIVENKLYRSKNLNETIGEMGTAEAVGQFLGFTPLSVTELYNYKTTDFKYKKNLSGFRNHITNTSKLASSLLATGERDKIEKALGLVNDMGAQIEWSGFSLKDKQALRRVVISAGGSDKTLKRLIDTDKEYSARALSKRLEGN